MFSLPYVKVTRVGLPHLVVAWYVFGALCNSTSKQALTAVGAKVPISLTALQFFSAALLGNLAISVLQLPRIERIERAWWPGLLRLTAVYLAGFIFTNASLGAVSASFTETVKASEPITTVALVAAFLPAEGVTRGVVASLVPIVCGVMLSSLSEASFSAFGFGMAMVSNLCFSARSLCAKQVVTSSRGALDITNLFVIVNTLALVVLFPLALALEGASMLDALTAMDGTTKLLMFNGAMYYSYNQMSFLVLGQVAAVTHGLINAMRRVANIVFAICYFGNRVTPLNIAGIALSVCGAIAYGRVKAAAAVERPRTKSE